MVTQYIGSHIGLMSKTGPIDYVNVATFLCVCGATSVSEVGSNAQKKQFANH